MPIDTQPIAKPQLKTETRPEEQFHTIIPQFTVNDLILPDSTLCGIQDFLSYQKHAELIFNGWGLSQTHSHQRQIAINLYGLPGTGKTMAAHAISHALDKPIIAVNYSEIESKYVGETSKNLTKLFEFARDKKAIIFFDEADAMLSRRVSNMSNSTDVSVNQTRSVLLTLMNNHEGLIIFTTNFIENYDSAFMRRILSHILFELPSLDNRQKLWHMYIPIRMPLSANVTTQILAEKSEGLSGSDISTCVLKAALSSARENSEYVDLTHFERAINEIRVSGAANKKQNSHPNTTITTNVVNEDYVKLQIGEEKTEELKR